MSETLQTETSSADDLRSVLSAAFEASEPAHTETTQTEAPPRQDRARDEHGRFTRAEQQAAEGAAPAEETDTTDQPATREDEPASQAIAPPASWSDAEKAHWTSLSRDAQETILRRERDIDKALAERANESQAVAPLREVLAPYRSKHAMMGLSDAEAVRKLLAAQEMLEQDPDRAFPELARAFGYDLSRLAPQLTQQVPLQQQQQQPQQFRDPRVDEILRMQQQREQQQAFAAVETFGKDPAHPHFQEVRQHMGVLLQNGGATDLQDAYDKAVWAMPAIREKLLAERERSAQAEREAAAKQKAAEARRASVSVRDNASAGGTGAVATAASLREELERAWVQ